MSGRKTFRGNDPIAVAKVLVRQRDKALDIIRSEAWLWAALKDNGWSLMLDKEGSFNVCELRVSLWSNDVISTIHACDPDPREAVRKAMKAETEK